MFETGKSIKIEGRSVGWEVLGVLKKTKIQQSKFKDLTGPIQQFTNPGSILSVNRKAAKECTE